MKILHESMLDDLHPTPLRRPFGAAATVQTRLHESPAPDNVAPSLADGLAEIARPVPGWWEALLWTLGFLLMSQIVPGIVLLFWAVVNEVDLEQSFEVYGLPTLFAGQLLGVGWTLCALRLRIGRNWKSALQLKRPSLIPCLLAVLCLPAVVNMASYLGQLAGDALGVQEPSRQAITEGLAQNGFWFCFLVIAIGPALGEELFCRGLLGHGLVGRYGVWVGVLLTSIIFGVIHLNVPQGIYAFLLGIGMHLAYLATRSLWVPILLHFVNNSAAVLMITFIPELETSDIHLWWINLPALAVAFWCVRELVRRRQHEALVLQAA